jgi:hypothetical protein
LGGDVYLFVLAGAFVDVVPPVAGAVEVSPPLLQPVKTAQVTRPNSTIRAMIRFIDAGKVGIKAAKNKRNL